MKKSNNLTKPTKLTQSQNTEIQEACRRIAPTWPLDQFIAVNPFWEMTNRSIQDVSAWVATASGAQCLMPRKYYLEQIQKGNIQTNHLTQAIKESSLSISEKDILNHLGKNSELTTLPLYCDLLDQKRDLIHQMSWKEEIVHQISQFCAAAFNGDFDPLMPHPPEMLYRNWLDMTIKDKGITLLMDADEVRDFLKILPEDPETLMGMAISDFELEETQIADWAHTLLLSINGWASWAAYLRWQAKLQNSENHAVNQLLAIRLAWEWVLLKYGNKIVPLSDWKITLNNIQSLKEKNQAEQKLDWICQRAAEISFQSFIEKQLLQSSTKQIEEPILQAAFCIDVRSEVFRRHLEAIDARIQTLGFAGFFGIPMEYQPLGTQLTRPQLPGLLSPQIKITDKTKDGNSERFISARKKILNQQDRWAQFSQSSPSTFTFVEATGLYYGYKLIKNAFFPSKGTHSVNDLYTEKGTRPVINEAETPLTLPEKTEVAKKILTAMSLGNFFAPVVLLVGHGSQTRNNPYASGLDCGACCGQTGEANARVLAGILNDPEVRNGLKNMEIQIPDSTQFVAALHNTTTDEVTMFDLDYCSLTAEQIEQIKNWLNTAKKSTQQERAPRLGLDSSFKNLNRQIMDRTSDWSQVRSEWGLANNASFIVAPRNRIRNTKLHGRSFLHDYQWQKDPDFKVLELIMTAPMIVTHWINMQYNISVTDNERYGTGNKVLHNVVGKRLGVFEGNGGDLRIGLAMQSVHDGKNWIHNPLRLSVYIQAPREEIEKIILRHETVKQLIENEWLYLFQIESENDPIYRYINKGWKKNN